MKKNKPIDPKQQYVFADKVFRNPYTPFYDSYKDHIFVIDPDDFSLHAAIGIKKFDHVRLLCVDEPSVVVNGVVHMDLLRRWWG